MKKRKYQFWPVVFFISVLIHVVFCLQALSVANRGGMIRNDNSITAALSMPHAILMYCLPPDDPFSHQSGHIVIDWWRFAGKLVDAYPASLLYGIILAAIWILIWNKKPKPGD